jgi:hypothetical protein
MQTLIDQLKERAEGIVMDTGCDVSICPRVHVPKSGMLDVSYTIHLHGENGIYTASEPTIDEAERRARDEMATGENPETAAALYEKQAAELTAKAQKIRMNGKPE